MVAVSPGIAVETFRVVNTGADHIFGNLIVIRAFFLLGLALHAYRLVIVDGEYPDIIGRQIFPTPAAVQRTTEALFPVIHHSRSLPHDYSKTPGFNSFLKDG